MKKTPNFYSLYNNSDFLFKNKYYNKYIIQSNRRHTYHLVDNSAWPFCVSISLLFTLIGFIMYINLQASGGFILLFGFFMIIVTVILWFRDIIREATYLGHHTKAVQYLLKTGMVLFIVSEVMFFFGFFWGFFHSSVSPNTALGGIWPPNGILLPKIEGIPLLNTVILLCSGVTITRAQVGLKFRDLEAINHGFIYTLIYAFFFLGLQLFEYFHLNYDIRTGIFGSTFFMLTGLHGLHVLAGMLFIFVCYIRFLLFHYNAKHHLSVTFAAWYWHFVDVVWLVLFLFVYCWGCWSPNIIDFKFLTDFYSFMNKSIF